MAIPLVKLINGTIKSLLSNPKCSKCSRKIDEHPDEIYKISGKILCSDCYYQSLGEYIDSHPIPSVRRFTLI